MLLGQQAEAGGSAGAHGRARVVGRQARKDGGPDARALRRRWAQMIKRIYEVDPLVCPRCQAEMEIIAFIIDPGVVDKILRHLERKEADRQRGPPGAPDLEAAS